MSPERRVAIHLCRRRAVVAPGPFHHGMRGQHHHLNQQQVRGDQPGQQAERAQAGIQGGQAFQALMPQQMNTAITTVPDAIGPIRSAPRTSPGRRRTAAGRTVTP